MGTIDIECFVYHNKCSFFKLKIICGKKQMTPTFYIKMQVSPIKKDMKLKRGSKQHLPREHFIDTPKAFNLGGGGGLSVDIF